MLFPWVSVTLLFAVLLDAILGETRRFHPLVGFGQAAYTFEKAFNHGGKHQRFLMGVFSWALLVLPIPVILLAIVPLLEQLPLAVQLIIDGLIVYFALGLKSLYQHGMQIFAALSEKNMPLARKYCGYIVSRDTTALTEQQISRATVESMLENSHDAVTATLICYLIGGAPLVVLHRLVNTLDAMWGYRNGRFEYFGKFAARADDVLGFIPAKITALLYAMLSPARFGQILKNAYCQARQYKSHNGGWVMAAGATLIRIQLGGSAVYHGKTCVSPVLGQGREVQVQDIATSLKRVVRVVFLLLALTCLFEVSLNLMTINK